MLDNPDFNFKSLRVNAVFRWEFRPGSTAYVVWTQQRQHEGARAAWTSRPTSRACSAQPSDNVFMVKVSYWFSR